MDKLLPQPSLEGLGDISPNPSEVSPTKEDQEYESYLQKLMEQRMTIEEYAEQREKESMAAYFRTQQPPSVPDFYP